MYGRYVLVIHFSHLLIREIDSYHFIEYRLREIIYNSSKFMKHSKRKSLKVNGMVEVAFQFIMTRYQFCIDCKKCIAGFWIFIVFSRV